MRAGKIVGFASIYLPSTLAANLKIHLQRRIVIGVAGPGESFASVGGMAAAVVRARWKLVSARKILGRWSSFSCQNPAFLPRTRPGQNNNLPPKTATSAPAQATGTSVTGYYGADEDFPTRRPDHLAEARAWCVWRVA